MTALLALALVQAAAPAMTSPEVRLEHAVIASVVDRLQALDRHPSVAVSNRIDLPSLPADGVTFEIGVPAGRLPRPRFAVPVRVLVDGRPVQSLAVWVSVSEPREVATYARDYARGTPADQVTRVARVVDLACCPGQPIAEGVLPAGAQLTRAVVAGSPAMGADFEAVAAVRRGETIVLEAGTGTVRLSVEGVALEDGRLGERVSVRTGDATRAVEARVVSTGKVAIDE